ncbi:MAG: hypothetical protein ACKVPJ_04730 [Chitinophagales bacterium]
MYDLSNLYKIARGNSMFIEKMLTLFLAETTIINKLIIDNYKKHAFNEVKTLAHKLKSNLQVLGITILKKQISIIEEMDVKDFELRGSDNHIHSFCSSLEVTLNMIQQNELGKTKNPIKD